MSGSQRNTVGQSAIEKISTISGTSLTYKMLLFLLFIGKKRYKFLCLLYYVSGKTVIKEFVCFILTNLNVGADTATRYAGQLLQFEARLGIKIELRK